MRAAALLLVMSSVVAVAQDRYDPYALTMDQAPIYLRADASLTPLVTMPKDTRLTVLQLQDQWVMVEFPDRQFGRRIGYVARTLVTVVQPTASATPPPVREQPSVSAASAPDPVPVTNPPTAPRVTPAAPPRETTASSAASVVASAPRASATGYRLAPAVIDEAIAYGSRRKNAEHGLRLIDSQQVFMVLLAGSETSSGFSLVVYTPIAWLRQQAARAAKEYRQMTAADVGDSFHEPILRVFVNPDTPNQVSARGMVGTSSVQHVVLRDEKRSIAIQPLSKSVTSEEVSNAMGGRANFEGLIATFALDALREIRGAKGDAEFFITIVGTSGEERDFRVKRKHFADLPE
jgi:hypothetical protein